MKMIEQHNNQGSDHTQKAKWLYSRSLAPTRHSWPLGCVRLPNKACGPNRTMNVEKQAEATKRFWICVIPIKTPVNDPVESLQQCANQRCIDNEQSESHLEKLQQQSGSMKTRRCKMF